MRLKRKCLRPLKSWISSGQRLCGTRSSSCEAPIQAARAVRPRVSRLRVLANEARHALLGENSSGRPVGSRSKINGQCQTASISWHRSNRQFLFDGT